ncbi:MAG: hypothetical protein D6772_03365 [Bacteroidetes bacterium]|nr:MAG: hypothetical protein D6772_03365 [Bacteroidota bacterium]
MPNKPVHLVAGVLTGAVVSFARIYYLDHPTAIDGEVALIGPFSLASIMLISAAVGGQFGLLPDILEPAKRKEWRHRRFFHSYALLAMLLWFTYQTETNPELHELVRHFFTVAAAGYVSHLLLDSRTPAGLPWI